MGVHGLQTERFDCAGNRREGISTAGKFANPREPSELLKRGPALLTVGRERVNGTSVVIRRERRTRHAVRGRSRHARDGPLFSSPGLKSGV